MPECPTCRKKINAFEVNAAKRSRFAIKRTANAPRPRSRGGVRRGPEFAVDPQYLLLPNPEMGHPDAVIRHLDSAPELLPQVLVHLDREEFLGAYHQAEDFLRLADALDAPRESVQRGSPPPG